jgi:hypothetical protein
MKDGKGLSPDSYYPHYPIQDYIDWAEKLHALPFIKAEQIWRGLHYDQLQAEWELRSALSGKEPFPSFDVWCGISFIFFTYHSELNRLISEDISELILQGGKI